MSPIRRNNVRPADSRHAARAASSSSVACVVAALAVLTSSLTSHAQPSTQPSTDGAKITDAAAAPVPEPAATQPLPWFEALPAGLEEARRKNQPVLVAVGAAWCPECRELEKQIATPAAQAVLAAWTRVRLDVDRDAEAARGLAVGVIPALRVLTPDGRVVASHNGYLPAADLAAWLDGNRANAVATTPTDVDGPAPADPAAVDALIAKLTSADAVVREAVTR